MLPVQPYRPGKYPPGPRWAQFGDDILGGAADAKSALEKKKLWKHDYHLKRLQDDRMMPLYHRFATHRDPEEQATDAYDRPPPPDHPARERPDVNMGGDDDVEMESPPGRPPPPPPAARIMRDRGTGPDRRDMEDIGLQAGGGPPPPPPPARIMRDSGTGPDRRDMEEIGVQAGSDPPPPPDRRNIGSNTENPRSDAGTQASFQPPPPPDEGYAHRQRRSRSPMEMMTHSGGPPPPQPPPGGVVAIQRQKKDPEDVLMVSSSSGKPPPGGGGGMEVDRPIVRKRASDMDIGEAMKDTAMYAARSRRQGELERKSDKKESMGDMQRAHLEHQEQQKQAAAEMARKHAAQTRDLRHQRDVAVGAAARGRTMAAAVAPTIHYPQNDDAATIAYPAHVQHFDISGRSRSPLLPTGSARSVSAASHSHSHDPKRDALAPYSKHGKGRRK